MRYHTIVIDSYQYIYDKREETFQQIRMQPTIDWHAILIMLSACFLFMLSSVSGNEYQFIEEFPTVDIAPKPTARIQKHGFIRPKVRRPPIPAPRVEVPRPLRRPKYKHPFESEHPT